MKFIRQKHHFILKMAWINAIIKVFDEKYLNIWQIHEKLGKDYKVEELRKQRKK
ncbi:unnamed protein product [Paramecium sonneborni]|uniref:Uncharacterized protein n=1 Tax=Paramecium sonneborni TaxID=65129 RepID=A0A8S1QM16_9CILI|nr:unnamed protein product [Paramecium sonneborni]